MVPDFAWLPPEVNSARIYSGAGSGSLHAAAAAWEGLAADLWSSAASFQSVLAGLLSGPWTGPASLSMSAAAAPYMGWLSAAAGHAALAGTQARVAATTFETALAATVHPAVVSANRMALKSLIATNFFGLNTPGIAAAEFDYVEMWAQDVAAMVGYHTEAISVASSLSPFGELPSNLAGLAALIGGELAEISTTAGAALGAAVEGAVATAPALAGGLQSAAAALPLDSVMSMGQMAAGPAGMLLGPIMQLGQSGGASAGEFASQSAAALTPDYAAEIGTSLKSIAGGAGISAGTGDARTLGAMSVPPSWQGSLPAAMASPAMVGLGMNGLGFGAAEIEQEAAATAGSSGLPMMPMPMGAGGAGAGAGGMLGRGGGSPHVVQNRPTVVPRTGIG